MKARAATTQAAKAVLALAIIWLCNRADAATFSSTYVFNNPTDVPTLANATYTSFSRTALTTDTQSGTFAAAGWSTGNSQLPTQFVQFTLTPSSGYYLTMSSLTFDIARNPQGPVNGMVEIFLGASPSPLTSHGTQNFAPTTTPGLVNFDFTDFTGANNQGITVRFYGWNAQNANGALFFDNVTINGDLSPVPEPVNLALAGFGLCFVGGAAYRKARAKSRVAA